PGAGRTPAGRRCATGRRPGSRPLRPPAVPVRRSPPRRRWSVSPLPRGYPDWDGSKDGNSRSMSRLRRADPSLPGYTRRRAGKGFVYLDETGQRIVDTDVLARIRALVIPPAWEDVWICPWPTGLGAGNAVTFDYPAKSGKRRMQTIVDEDVFAVVAALKRRRTGGPVLFAFRSNGRWVDLHSSDINDFVKELTGGEFTAKDFR